jgi:hypothetical protein
VHLLEQGLFFRSINFGKFDGRVLLLQDLGGLDKFCNIRKIRLGFVV